MGLRNGLLVETRRVGQLNRQRGHRLVLPEAIDIRCQVAVATSLTCTVAGGCTWVKQAFDSSYPYSRGCRPAIALADGELKAVLGVLVEGQGTLTAGDGVWVRVWGVAPYALMKGDGTNVTTNSPLMGAAAGKAVVLTAGGYPIGTYVGADTLTGAASVGAVLVCDPARLLAGV